MLLDTSISQRKNDYRYIFLDIEGQYVLFLILREAGPEQAAGARDAGLAYGFTSFPSPDR